MDRLNYILLKLEEELKLLSEGRRKMSPAVRPEAVVVRSSPEGIKKGDKVEAPVGSPYEGFVGVVINVYKYPIAPIPHPTKEIWSYGYSAEVYFPDAPKYRLLATEVFDTDTLIKIKK